MNVVEPPTVQPTGAPDDVLRVEHIAKSFGAITPNDLGPGGGGLGVHVRSQIDVEVPVPDGSDDEGPPVA